MLSQPSAIRIRTFCMKGPRSPSIDPVRQVLERGLAFEVAHPQRWKVAGFSGCLHERTRASGLEENTKSKGRPVQGWTDLERPAIHSVAVAKMHAAVPHCNPEMTSKLPLGAGRCGHVHV